MKKNKPLIPLIFIFIFLIGHAIGHAAVLRHTYGNDYLNSFYIDDQGGSEDGGAEYSYFLNLRDIDQSAHGTILLYVDQPSGITVDNGYPDEDFISGSGIWGFNFPGDVDLNGPLPNTVSGQVGLASSSPLTPVSFTGSQSGVRVEQVSYTSNRLDHRFVIVEYRVVNTTTNPIQARLGLSNDFEVDLFTRDYLVGYEDGIPLVFQQEQPYIDPYYTTVGTSLIRGSLAQYRLERCGEGFFDICDILGDDVVQQAFFEGASGFVGDLSGIVYPINRADPESSGAYANFAVTIAADLGTIEPGEGATAVFCYNASQINTAPNPDCDGDGDVDLNDELCRDDCNGDGVVDALDAVCRDDCDGNGIIDADDYICEFDCDGDGDVDNDDQTCWSNQAIDNCANSATHCETFYEEQIEHCGNGLINFGEQCDDGDLNLHDSCPDGNEAGLEGSCQPARCGDGYLWNEDGGSEICDDGDENLNDACPDGDEGSCEPARCGDGYLWNEDGGTEACDDNNLDNGDGCTSACAIEVGWDCTGRPSDCQPICGDGLIRGTEQCDDGNLINGDGCNSSCDREPDWTCVGEPSVCQNCGNGIIEGTETCDDNNETSGDGCNATCQIEGGGWTCTGTPSVCQNCGNGIVEGTETCDDNNIIPGDGCNATCQVETGTGWSCSSVPGELSVCQNCGNGIIEGTEACDDLGTESGDGCDGSCQIETGWTCTGEASTCQPICGDGLIRGDEQCDDHDLVNGDGCDNNCQIETSGSISWTCEGEPSVCFVCGNGVIERGEDCDDGNRENEDGCSSTCDFEPGWDCSDLSVGCVSICGDNIKVKTESCDDGNLLNGDGCNEQCGLEIEVRGSGGVSGNGGGCALVHPSQSSHSAKLWISMLALLMLTVFGFRRTKIQQYARLR